MKPLLSSCCSRSRPIPRKSASILAYYTGPGKGQGIYTGVIDSDTGRLGPVTLAVKANNPGYLAFSPDGAHLYSVSSDGEARLRPSASQEGGALRRSIMFPQCGGGPGHLLRRCRREECHRARITAAGSIACSFGIKADGSLGALVSTVKFHRLRARSRPGSRSRLRTLLPLTARASSSTRATSAPIMSGVTISTARPAGSARLPMGMGMVPPGSGARHLAFGPGQDFAYVNGEMGRNVTVFHHDKSTGH